MRKLLEITIDPEGEVTFMSEYKPLKGMNLYQDVFVSLLFETDTASVRRWMEAIRILGLADVTASVKPGVAMSMFESTLRDLAPLRDRLLKNFGGNLNFQLVAS